jgi:hypothetical protein
VWDEHPPPPGGEITWLGVPRDITEKLHSQTELIIVLKMSDDCLISYLCKILINNINRQNPKMWLFKNEQMEKLFFIHKQS